MVKGIYTMSRNTFFYCDVFTSGSQMQTLLFIMQKIVPLARFIFYRYIFFISLSFIPFMYSYDLDKCIFFFFSFSLLPFFFFFAAPASWIFIYDLLA